MVNLGSTDDSRYTGYREITDRDVLDLQCILKYEQKCIDYIEKWPFMVIFQYNLYIFGIHLWTVLYPNLCYNEPCYKEVVVFCIYLMYSDRQTWANRVDPEEMPLASRRGLHCLPLIQQLLDTLTGNKLHLFKF